MQQTIESECIRQIDKTNNNRIGYFHQNMFRFAGHGWVVPENGEQGGFDVLNDELHIYVEMKNKHNTMNAALFSIIPTIEMINALLSSFSFFMFFLIFNNANFKLFILTSIYHCFFL